MHSIKVCPFTGVVKKAFYYVECQYNDCTLTFIFRNYEAVGNFYRVASKRAGFKYFKKSILWNGLSQRLMPLVK